MRSIRTSGTLPELVVRSSLHRLGYRFRTVARALPGSPDVVLPKHSAVVMVHGCFWHRHPRCPFAAMPSTRVAFWNEKFRRNKARDRRVMRELQSLGWKVVIVWECETKSGGLATLLKRRIGCSGSKKVNRKARPVSTGQSVARGAAEQRFQPGDIARFAARRRSSRPERSEGARLRARKGCGIGTDQGE